MAAEPNVVLINWLEKVLPDEYFYDTGHLNYEGAVAFSTMLAEELDRLGIVFPAAGS